MEICPSLVFRLLHPFNSLLLLTLLVISPPRWGSGILWIIVLFALFIGLVSFVAVLLDERDRISEILTANRWSWRKLV
ncbi:hypothetical protein AB6A40_011581 [Gnathostoma spinigerum]|uniref:Uncharacterized protein n=1 Tax=Gnathostoma spinigerum TaxID=75299 RepID=A0ABD6F474_9BILA